MAILDRTRQTDLLKSILNGTTWPVVPAGWKIRLGSNAPTVTVAMTEITGTGYTAGGTAVTFNTAAAGVATGPTATTTWTNSSGGSWSIVGIEIWDTAGTPLRWFFGTWTGQPITVANGNTFQVAAAAVTADNTAW
jgi:Rieske Fe-S protein